MVYALVLYVFLTVVRPAWAGTNKAWAYLGLLIVAFLLDGFLFSEAGKDMQANAVLLGVLGLWNFGLLR